MKQEFAYIIRGRKPKTPHQEKALVKESKLIMKKCSEVEDGFLRLIFDEEVDCTYQEIYDLYSGAWNELCEKFSKQIYYFNINNNYFYNQYRPE